MTSNSGVVRRGFEPLGLNEGVEIEIYMKMYKKKILTPSHESSEPSLDKFLTKLERISIRTEP